MYMDGIRTRTVKDKETVYAEETVKRQSIARSLLKKEGWSRIRDWKNSLLER